MTSFERCYTPSPKAVEVEHAFALKEWMSPFLTMLHNISNPHAFKFTKKKLHLEKLSYSTRIGEVINRKTGNPLALIQSSG